MAASGRSGSFDEPQPNGWLRRISPIAGRPGEGLLTELAAVARPGAREQVVMPHSALAPKLDAQSFRFCQERSQRGAQKGTAPFVLRLLRLWPFLLLTPYRRAR